MGRNIDKGRSATRADGSTRSRGYVKLSQAPYVDFRDAVVLDIGSSTGGFTQYALDQGAWKVIAVEKGTRQMMEPLRYDFRVELHEKTDIFDVTVHGDAIYDECRIEYDSMADEKIVIEWPDIILADVSFVSLTKVLKYAKMELTRPATRFLVMLKPQFEAKPYQLNRGVVKNEKMRREIIRDFEKWLKTNGFVVLAKRDNELTGKNGNRERFYLLALEK